MRFVFVLFLCGFATACSKSKSEGDPGPGDVSDGGSFDGGSFDSGTSSPVGSTLAHVTLLDQRTSGAAESNVVATFGQVFAAGDVPANATVEGKASDGTAITLQVDKKATYADGSLRHAVITAVGPSLAAGGTLPIDLVSTTRSAASGHLDFATLAATAFDAVVTITIAGTVYTASVKPLLTGATQLWLDGPVTKEAIVTAPLKDASGNAHPQLQAYFQVRMDVNGAARVDVIVDNDWAFAPGPSNFTYDLAISVAGQPVYAKSALLHYQHARWRETFYWNRDAEPFVQHDVKYLIASGAVPNYDPSVVASETELATFGMLPAPPWDPMQIGQATAYMPATGGRIDLGLLPGWAALWAISADPRAARATLMTADGSGSWSIHYRDQVKGLPVSLVDYPYMTLLGNPEDTDDPSTGKSDAFPACTDCDSPNSSDSAHQPAFVYLPYLLTGDHYYLEELQFWTDINLFESNPAYRAQQKGLFNWDQVRGQAWSMRTLGEAAAFTPDDDPLKGYFNDRLNDNLDYYTTKYAMGGATTNALGFITDGFALGYVNGQGVGPWQDDFFTSAIGHLVELGFTQAIPLMTWKSISPVSRMTAPGFCWIQASAYDVIVRDASDTTTTLYPTYAQVYDATVDPSVKGLACGSQAMATALMLTSPDQMVGYAPSPEGYPANLQPALAMAAQFRIGDAEAAWATFAGRATPPDYSTEPQFAIVPRR